MNGFDYESLPSVAGIYITPVKSAPLASQVSVEAIAGQGLKGDRFFRDARLFSDSDEAGAQVTFIQKEALDAVNAGHQTDFTPEMLRRNILTSNIDLASLLGRRFRCGAAVLRGTEPYPPCGHLAHLLGRREVLKFFANSCGIGAEIVESGEIRVGDRIQLIGD